MHQERLDHLAVPYFESLKKLFTRLETQLGMPVIVAAHPKAEYTHEFGERRIEYGKSVRLVQSATCVVATLSASIGFVMMFHKPLLLIASDLRLKSNHSMLRNQNAYQQYLAEMLGVEVLKIDQMVEGEPIRIVPVDEQVRKAYLYRFHTAPGIEHRMNMEFLPQIYEQLMDNAKA